jgi:hypothetical protein
MYILLTLGYVLLAYSYAQYFYENGIYYLYLV